MQRPDWDEIIRQAYYCSARLNQLDGVVGDLNWGRAKTIAETAEYTANMIKEKLKDGQDTKAMKNVKVDIVNTTISSDEYNEALTQIKEQLDGVKFDRIITHFEFWDDGSVEIIYREQT